MKQRLRDCPGLGLLAHVAKLAAVAATAGALGVTPCVQAASAPILNIHTTSAGVYQVRFEDLVAPFAQPSTGSHRESPTGSGPWHSAGLGFFNRGSAVPIWVEDGGDGVFGAGDTFEFVAEILPGSHGALHEYSSSNVYQLSLTASDPARMTSAESVRRQIPPPGAHQDYSGSLHLEVDTLLMRFGCQRESQHELWYWQKIQSVDDEPFRHEFEAPGLDRSRGPARLEIDLHGWSALYKRPDPSVTDHRLEVYLNGTRIHEESWNGKLTHSIKLSDLDPGLFRSGRNTISLRVPARRDAEGRLITDAVVLNWMRLDYPRTSRVEPNSQAHYDLPPGVRGGTAVLESPGPARVYAADGTRFDHRPGTSSNEGEARPWLEFAASAAFRVAPEGSLLTPEFIVPYVGERLASLAQQADYITIVPRELREAIEPLMQYRKAQGLSVEVALLDEVYDAFNDGIPHPRAIREFLRHAYRTWPGPAPRFALLVGDASWDSKHERPQLENYAFKTGPLQNHGVGRAEGTRYADPSVNNRGLIPTWNYLTHAGHAASDNWFVSFDEDPAPEMAIGRFPVIRAAEVTDIVNKTMAHERAAEGEWRKKTLWITNEQAGFQRYSDQMASSFAERGYVARKIYPRPGEAGNSQRIIDALDEGQFLVYFYGHGGRFIWRTSPADLNHNRDLFSLQDLDRLRPTVNTPVVVSFTCYSAPFDHPSEDSIGEKLVRIGGRGAVAVIAASWRNVPSLTMQTHYMNALAESETIGEAVVAAKRQITRRDIVETYNLLGDPALRLNRGQPRPAAKSSASIDGHRALK